MNVQAYFPYKHVCSSPNQYLLSTPNTLPLFTHTPQKEVIPLHNAQGKTTQITFFQKDLLWQS